MLLSPLSMVQDTQDATIADPRTSESLILLLDPLLLDPLLLDPLDTLEPETLFKETLEPTNLFLDTLDTLKGKPPLPVPLLPW